MNSTTNFHQSQNKAIVSMGYDNTETNITLAPGHGSTFPDPSFVGPYNVVWWNASDYISPIDDPYVEIVQCIAKIGDTLVVMRSQQNTFASSKNIYGKLYNMMPLPGGNLESLSYYNVPRPHGSASHTGTIGDHAANLTSIGTNTHTQIDTHIGATVSVHGFDASGNAPAQTHGISRHTGTIGDHTTNLSNVGSNTHAQIDTALTASAGHIAASGTSVHSLGTMSTQSAGSVTITGGTITGVTSIGIGTASPGQTLGVNGDIGITNTKSVGSNYETIDSWYRPDYGISMGGASSGSGVMGGLVFLSHSWGSSPMFGFRDTYTNALLVSIIAGGNVGIGTASPDGIFTVVKDTAYNVFGGTTVKSSSTNPDSVITIGVDATNHIGFIQTSSYNSYTNRPLSLQPNGGNVGIGTASPTMQLEVRAPGNVLIGGFLRTTSTSPDTDRRGISFDTGSFTDRSIYVDVSTNANISGAMFFKTHNSAYQSSFNFVDNGDSVNHKLDNKGNSWFNAINGGNVGIGTASPNQKLSVAGIIESTTGGIKFPDATIQTTAAAGSAGWTLVTKTSAFTAASDNTILCNAVGGNMIINLPAAASNANKIYNIKKIDSSGNSVTIDANASETIDGSLTKSLNTQYESITIQCDGANWYII